MRTKTKVCTNCKIEKDRETDFTNYITTTKYKNKVYRYPRTRAMCRRCASKLTIKWQKKNREKLNRYQRNYYKNKRLNK